MKIYLPTVTANLISDGQQSTWHVLLERDDQPKGNHAATIHHVPTEVLLVVFFVISPASPQSSSQSHRVTEVKRTHGERKKKARSTDQIT